ncbi:methyl-accepting chemotaxis protein [Vibrio aestuarianus]|uniref:HAMP domain-containing protein n=2 Tax=Vibrio aestuarianus TaxID=28171 RepID=A0ABM9FRP6_9VIBR|nr:methyl-accepting chemotaxis protein [Vibrio aestuarianus]MDE1215197.1 methyl-accepting chemotaxis protein [Vibrio aestuarianus]MDE1217417.1 methyl-accepting chemotaxis protein [Vibrio aestuarianus]MDE1257156.1 methyl-accepting chemotaxis protein [Vibrio aestuarianus]MDE1262305.1 methyl-accepting chemotaxis protein [Vibrio aestuarianus]MDE1269387.1 methyl-accepting chemotaxis protein [Vibrio aestuarianus]
MKFSNLSIKSKISALILIISVAVIALSFFFYSQIKLIDGEMMKFSHTTVPSILLVKNIEVEVSILRKDEFSLLTNVNHAEFKTWLKGLDKSESKVDNYIKKYGQSLWDQRDRDAFNRVNDAWEKYRSLNEKYSALLLTKQVDEANAMLLDGFPAFQELQNAIIALVELNQTFIKEDIDSTHIVVTDAVTYGIIAIVALLALGFSLGLFLTKQICSPLNYVVEMASKIASGDLTYQLPRNKIGNDELGILADACIDMQAKLLSLVDSISSITAQVSTATEEVSAISEQTSSGMDEQQQQLNLIATAMNEMQATVNDVANNTEAASETANGASNDAKQGLEVVQECISQINEASVAIQSVGTMVSELEQNASNISVVVDVIQDIAEQTNLLALNAAIEAARAGEQGRGFAVVSDEVRTLASRTQSSTEEIVSIISKLQNCSKTAVSATNNSNDLIQVCVEQAQNAGATIGQIERSVDNIAEKSIQIASACSEQSSVTEELHRNVEHINQFSSEVATGSRQTAVACRDLSELAVGLQEIVSQFKTA